MNSYRIADTRDRLEIERDRALVVMQILTSTIPFWFLLTLLCYVIFVRHAPFSGPILGMAIITLVAALGPYSCLAYLPRKVVVLDRAQNAVLVDGEWQCAFTDVRTVTLGRYLVPTAKDQPFTRRGLYLKLANGNAVLIERFLGGGRFNSDLKQLGQKVAAFAHLPWSG